MKVEWNPNVHNNDGTHNNETSKALRAIKIEMENLSPGDQYDSGWVTPALQNGWAVASGSEFRYRRIGRVVYIEGRVDASGASGTTLFNLPEGFRPATKISELAVST